MKATVNIKFKLTHDPNPGVRCQATIELTVDKEARLSMQGNIMDAYSGYHWGRMIAGEDSANEVFVASEDWKSLQAKVEGKLAGIRAELSAARQLYRQQAETQPKDREFEILL